ncbi:MAG: imidazoleglycerol-phosphate dehydratase HisB [Endomicrobiia bacterium]|nr:imidazoleglycerol-phosphate dehydratase HisB [Endomicrobiaceae bacterium]MDD3053364.1 imidazoleglycerol-phosphate dehydratase HisB [Endomicrobiaceae bacterium]MDD3922288.1 imidazoleglycerol-phosphate dehydratase HisB [Endomicrobiaceae bacterium]MDD5102306.1 imidazoleglycerol-phosphate dehydratase HisB [Endomicrobiaceae bacterium]
MKIRKAHLKRETTETKVDLEVNLDSAKKSSINTTIDFMDHMLTLFSAHAGISLNIKAEGDTKIDDHHLVEDIGITFGLAFKQAIGDKRGIVRYGHFLLPMDEALAYVALDISGRPHLSYQADIKFQTTGFNYDLIEEFLIAFVNNAGITLHIKMMKGRNNHHIAESIFKCFGRAMADAISVNKKNKNIPSTKGIL